MPEPRDYNQNGLSLTLETDADARTVFTHDAELTENDTVDGYTVDDIDAKYNHHHEDDYHFLRPLVIFEPTNGSVDTDETDPRFNIDGWTIEDATIKSNWIGITYEKRL